MARGQVSDDFDQWVLLDRSVRRHKLWGDMQKEVGNFVDELTIVKTRSVRAAQDAFWRCRLTGEPVVS
jgi:hypothetical protein